MYYHGICSALSQHGVHSFPVLFLHNKTVKVRYHGPRTVEAISEFYKAFTGLCSFRWTVLFFIV